jgi:hypothetical protein
MIPAKSVSITVRPFRVANLCFEVGGILGESFSELGKEVPAFDFANFYRVLRKDDINVNDPVPDRIKLDSDEIDRITKTIPVRVPVALPALKPPPGDPAPPRSRLVAPQFALAALRAEPQKAALNKAINQRANAFITKYGGVAAIADVMRKIIPFRGLQINHLSKLSDDLKNVLNAAYEEDPDRKGVVKTTTTDLSSPTETQHIVNKGYEFRVPIFENLARNERAQISIGEEVISFVRETHYLDRIEEVFKNELASIDADINQLQVAYLNTILLSPINGIVTGVYKNPGDAVSAGEPVFRVEDNSEVLIVANVICRGPIAIGSMLQVKTPLFDSPDSRVTLEARVVSARGQRDNDHWEVIAKRSNLNASGKTIFPLGYNFDYDATEVNIFEAGEI